MSTSKNTSDTVTPDEGKNTPSTNSRHKSNEKKSINQKTNVKPAKDKPNSAKNKTKAAASKGSKAKSNAKGGEAENQKMQETVREKIAVLGAGSFGTAMAYVASHNHDVVIYCRDENQANTINTKHYNPKRFAAKGASNSSSTPTFLLPTSITATTDLEHCIKDCAAIIHCIPAQLTPYFIKQNKHIFPAGIPYISTSKGLYHNKDDSSVADQSSETGDRSDHSTTSTKLMSEAIEEAFGGRATDGLTRAEIPLCYLSGPSFAAEMIKEDPMSVVVASHDMWCATRVQNLLSSKYFRVYTTDDVIGVEIGGALKNPLAIGTGCAQGLGFGQSTIAGIVTRGCLEMSQMSHALGGRRETLAGLSGFGDLMLTCYSDKSRNNRFGRCLAQGMSVSEAIEEIGETVEGYQTAIEVVKLAKRHNLFLPLFLAVERLVTGQRTPQELFDIMMLAPPTQERFIG